MSKKVVKWCPKCDRIYIEMRDYCECGAPLETAKVTIVKEEGVMPVIILEVVVP